MNNNDKTSFYILVLAASVVLLPVALIMFFVLKSKAKKSLEEMYTLEKELDNHYANYVKKRSEMECNNANVDKMTEKNALYSHFELLDSVENSIFLIREKLDSFESKMFFVKSLFVIKVKDAILEKNVTKYRFNHDQELATIESTKKRIYEKFGVINA
jgi:hypothetical protein